LEIYDVKLTRKSRALVMGAAATTAFALPASGASGQLLGLPLPNLGQIVQDLGATVDSVLPTGGVVTGVTGTVGGIVTGVESTVTGTVDSALGDVLGGVTGGLLPGTTLDQLLGTLGLTAVPGADGVGSILVFANGQPVVPGAPAVVDIAAPEPKVRVLSRLRQVHKTGSLRLQITSNEAGVMAVGGAVRPGLAVKSKKATKKARAAAVKHSRALIKFPAAILAFRKPGSLTMTVKVGKQARQALGRSRDGRISLAVIAADVYRNQTATNVKRKLSR
jgi:hypothetical protein